MGFRWLSPTQELNCFDRAQSIAWHQRRLFWGECRRGQRYFGDARYIRPTALHLTSISKRPCATLARQDSRHIPKVYVNATRQQLMGRTLYFGKENLFSNKTIRCFLFLFSLSTRIYTLKNTRTFLQLIWQDAVMIYISFFPVLQTSIWAFSWFFFLLNFITICSFICTSNIVWNFHMEYPRVHSVWNIFDKTYLYNLQKKNPKNWTLIWLSKYH